MARKATPRAFKRGGLHPLECSACDAYGYFTVAMLERAGNLPACFATGCSGRLEPREWELADILGVECRATLEYQAKCESVAHGQAGKAGLGRSCRVDGSSAGTAHWKTPSEKAAHEIGKDRRAAARARRLASFGVKETRGSGAAWREVTVTRLTDPADIPF